MFDIYFMTTTEIKNTLRQAADGEFATLRETASKMTAAQFAKAHGAAVWGWGKPQPVYDAVTVGGTDYLWRKSNGKYDGWDRVI